MRVLLDIPRHKTVEFEVCDTRPLDDLAKQAHTRFGSIFNPATTYFSGRFGHTARETLTTCTPWLTLQTCVRGGKGGFGSTLRSQSNRSTPTTFDDCRDLYGRRLRTLNDAKRIVEQTQTDEKLREEAKERRRKNIEENMRDRPVKKHRFDDTEFERRCEEAVELTRETTRKAVRNKLRKVKESESEDGVEPLIPLFEGELSSSDDESSSGDDDNSTENK
ncbi:hypothetical protein GGH15_004534 [Coemansia sp. RSA 562]|nr:hypothetical protein GGH15_004534 [Coemansia sp. RSA 562]KAJ2271693.1 hypothetical protein GGH14_004859 [Coemansia sp. RSA 370]KAJ2430094.1 hypothetical protein IWW41_003312 [Coemansia sp. RSA 2522]